MKIYRALACIVLAFCTVQCALAQETGDPPLRWWKGNLHTHSLWSDGDDFPEMIADWYAQQGYHFLALSDHNILSQGMKWMKADKIEARGGPQILVKYVKRFGPSWVRDARRPRQSQL